MKNRVLYSWIVVVFVLLFHGMPRAYSAVVVNNEIAIATIARPTEVSADTLEFSLHVNRTTDEWLRWANGTFEITLSNVQYSNLGIELIKDSTDLNLSVYSISPRIITSTFLAGNKITSERISITVLGPKAYTDAVEVQLDTTKPLKVGRFRVYTLDRSAFSNQATFNWLQPIAYYQAIAYKLPMDSIPWHVTDNNIEMRDRLLYRTEPRQRQPGMQIILCDSTYYEGQRVNRIQWHTIAEKNSYGFTLWRALLPYGETNTSTLVYEQIASFPGIGKGNSSNPQLYPPYFDSVNILRGERYFYKVVSMSSDVAVNVDSTGAPIEGICSITVPFAVIVKAVARENPFSSGTTIDYKLDDDVNLSIKVYDAIGKLVEVLMDNKFMKMGSHEIAFQASDYAIQGLYNVIFVATPIKDQSVELSKALLKLELIR